MSDIQVPTLTFEGEIARLRALSRKAQTDEFVTGYDKVEDGEKIKEVTIAGPAGTSKTVTRNLSNLYHSAPSTTGDVELLVIEAELLADGEGSDNPHIPLDDQTREAAIEQIEERGLTPAWEVVFDE